MSDTTSRGQHGLISVFRLDALAIIFLGAAALLWPLALTGGHPFMMVDSAIYADQGAQIWSFVGGLLDAARTVAPSPEATGAAAATGEAAPEVVQSLRSQAAADDTVRSIPYAAFVGLFLPLGSGVVLYVQAVLLIIVLYATCAPFLARMPGWGIAGMAAVVLFATPLPTMASYLMPDIFGAVVLLFAVQVILGLRRYTLATRVVLMSLALLAVIFHYGNVPFAILLFGFTALLQSSRRRALQTLAFAGGGIVVFALGLNALVGYLAFDGASAAPNRAPIVLARSIEDGPARWVLEEDCASAAPRYALCEYWGTDIPTNVGAALWEEGGMDAAPPELYSRIRAQEVELLIEGFRTYPAQQVGAFLGNAFDQFVALDTRYAVPSVFEFKENGRRDAVRVEDTAFEVIRPVLDRLHVISFFLGVAALVGLALMSGEALQRRIAAVVLAGLAFNAMVFGGLSAPVPRYQARVAWTALTLAMVLLASRKAAANGSRSIAIPKGRQGDQSR